jgi:tRNA(adenine34) deaminase
MCVIAFILEEMMDKNYMQEALNLAKIAFKEDEVPVGCVIVKDNQIIGKGYNKKEQSQNPLHHAEIIAIEEASKNLGTWRLDNCYLYVTLEPCPMCAGAIIQSRIKKVIFGAYDEKGGSFGTLFNLNDVKGLNHYPEVESELMLEESKTLLQEFFRSKRKK